MPKTFTTRIERYEPTDSRLGRHLLHDSRSLQYLVEASDPATLKSVRHSRMTPILDQGNLGSCTGNAAVGCLGTEPFYDTVNEIMSFAEPEAIHIYSQATAIDPFPGTYPPTDTGSNGLSVAKALKSDSLISGYLWATSLNAALTALASQPVIVGTKWFNDMFTPASDGKLSVSGPLAGGHEYELDELDVENQRVWMTNSWGGNWGVEGRAYMTWDDLGKLLDDGGDVTVFVANTKPAPTPTPPAPPAPPAPEDPKAIFQVHYEAFVAAAEKFFSPS